MAEYLGKYKGKEIDEALDLAKTALQEHQDISKLATKEELTQMNIPASFYNNQNKIGGIADFPFGYSGGNMGMVEAPYNTDGYDVGFIGEAGATEDESAGVFFWIQSTLYKYTLSDLLKGEYINIQLTNGTIGLKLTQSVGGAPPMPRYKLWVVNNSMYDPIVIKYRLFKKKTVLPYEWLPNDIAKTSNLDDKQNKLTAGDGINIDENNTISCTLDTSLYKVVTTLPDKGEENKIYLVQSEDTEEYNIYNEYAYVNGAWEALGKYKATIDLTPYAKKEDIPADYVSYNEQSLTDAQKAQVKTNLGIVDVANKEEMLVMKAYIYDLSGNLTQSQVESAFNVTFDQLIAGIKAGKAIIITSSSTENGNYNIVFGATYTLTSAGKLNTLSMMWWQYSNWCTLSMAYNTSYDDYTVTVTKKTA